MISQLELDKPEERRKPKKSVNGVFWIILLNLGLYVADHVFQVIKKENLYFVKLNMHYSRGGLVHVDYVVYMCIHVILCFTYLRSSDTK